MSGAFVVQCKFRSQEGTLSAADLQAEVPKVRRLHKQGLCDAYVLMTNARVTADSERLIRETFVRAGPQHVLVLDGGSIDKLLVENPALRTLVPRIYGLGDLSQILDDRAYAQAQSVMRDMREGLPKFVVTDPYRAAIERLNDHGFVLLLGEPGVGKSMIAAALAIDAIDLWNARTVKARTAGMFEQHWNPHEPGQFFWVDDAFGTTQYLLPLADEWNRIIPLLRAAIAGGTRVVMTSRDYIWHAARQDLKAREFEPLLRDQVLVEVRDLRPEDKQQILYNHLRLGTQSKLFKMRVKPFLEDAANVPVFLPEVARRFGNPTFTEKLHVSGPSVRSFFEHPVDHLVEVLQQLRPSERAAIALVFMANGTWDAGSELSEDERKAIALMGSTLGDAIEALHALDGSLLVSTSSDSGTLWSYKHPTIDDAFTIVVRKRPEQLLIQVLGMSMYSLLSRVTCGQVGIQNTIVLPKALYDLVARRIAKEPVDDRTRGFLAARCDDEFLRLVANEYPQVVREGLASGSVRLATRLNAAGLLPEASRLLIIQTISQRLLDGVSGDGARSAWEANLMTQDEFDSLVHAASYDLLPSLSEMVWDQAREYDESVDPQSWMEEIGGVIGFVADYGLDNPEVATNLRRAEATFDNAVRELWEEHPGAPDIEEDRQLRSDVYSEVSTSSIFSDVDS